MVEIDYKTLLLFSEGGLVEDHFHTIGAESCYSHYFLPHPPDGSHQMVPTRWFPPVNHDPLSGMKVASAKKRGNKAEIIPTENFYESADLLP